MRDLNRLVTLSAVSGLIAELTAKYAALPQVSQYLSKVREDVLDHA